MKNKHQQTKLYVVTLLFMLSSVFMYNMYKSLSGFIANGFRDGLMMLSIVTCYLLPVICFYFYLYNYHVKKINKIVKLVYSSIVAAIAIFNLTQIFTYLPLYISNNELGGYETLLSIGFGFPYDGLIINFVLIVVQVINIITTLKPNIKLAKYEDYLTHHGLLHLNIIEYILLFLLGILTNVFIGAFIIGFEAIENALYDGKYIYMMLLVLIIPTINFLTLLIKPNRVFKNKKILTLLVPLGINFLFLGLFILFESIYPSFMVNIAKPLFPITFSVSLPIEMLIIILIISISSIIYLVKLFIPTKVHK